MAASTRCVCSCTANLRLKAGFTFSSYVRSNEKIFTNSSSKSRFLCANLPVAIARKALSVTSIGPGGRRFLFHGHAQFIRYEQAARTVLNAPQCNRLYSSTTLRRNLDPCISALRQRRAVVCSQVLGLQNSFGQSESESWFPKQQANMFSSRSGSASRAEEEQEHDRTIVNNGRQEKKENIKTIPNLLTTLRMASAPLLGYMVVSETFGPALGLFALAGISDMLDGYIARNFPNQTSALGSALDPLADKLLVTILTISLTSVGLIPVPLTGLIVFRDVSLIAGGFYIRYKSLPPPITMSRYFDISHATVSLAPTFISKVNTGLQLSLVACSLAAPVFGFVDHAALQVLWWLTGTTTFLSGADYCWSWKKYVTLLEKDQKEL